MDRLTEIIQRQRDLQTRYGYAYDKMDVRTRVQTITEMYVAATQELGEALNEVSWKPWTSGEHHINAHRMASEIVDTFQFMLNMLFAAYPHISAEELAKLLNEKHAAKVQINDARQRDGYDGVSTKCPSCGRALDEVVLTEILDSSGYAQFCPCGHRVGTRLTPA